MLHTHHQRIFIAVGGTNFPSFESGNAKSERAFHFCGWHAEQSGLLAIDMQTQIGAPQSDWIVHVLRPFRA